jgi:hypothetical protein
MTGIGSAGTWSCFYAKQRPPSTNEPTGRQIDVIVRRTSFGGACVAGCTGDGHDAAPVLSDRTGRGRGSAETAAWQEGPVP